MDSPRSRENGMAPSTVVVRVKQAAIVHRHAFAPELESALREGFCCSGVLFAGGYILVPALLVAPFHCVGEDLTTEIDVTALVHAYQLKNMCMQWFACRVIHLFRNEEFHLMMEYFETAQTYFGSHRTLSDLDKELQELQLKSEIRISDFVILQTKDRSFDVPYTPIASAGSVCKADKVFVYGCPFGSALPEVFHSSISSGIVSNMLGSHNQLLITDARYVEGTEGSAMTVTVNDKECLVGIVITRIGDRRNGYSSSLTIVCSIDSIWKSLSTLDPELATILSDSEGMSTDDVQIRKRYTFNSTVLVKAGCHSGSGVVIDSDMKLVLTCGHVIQPPTADVEVSFSSNNGETMLPHCSAAVVWISDVPDVALLRLNTTTHLQPASLYDGKAANLTKANICLYGHSKLSHHHTGVSVTHGIISSVVCDGTQPVMLQTTAAISEGASGGAIVLADSNVLVGIAACNVSDETGKKYCDISLAVPISWIRSVIDAYKIQRLNNVKIGSVTATMLWQLKDNSKCPSMASKL